MKSIKNNKAITLIALIITIIILLIIAGVAISFTIGEDGIFDKSEQSAEKYKYQQAKEKLIIKLSDIKIQVLQENDKDADLNDLIIINQQDNNMKVDTTEDEEGYEIVNIEDFIDEEDNETEKKVATVTVEGDVFKVDENYNVIEGKFDISNEEEVPDGYIGIYNANDLLKVKNDLTANYILMKNINLKGVEIEPIGTSLSDIFTGDFNGNGKTIRNLTINKETESYIGLFGYNRGTIENLILEGVDVTGKNNVGGLVGDNLGRIENIILEGVNITGKSSNAGGLVGINGGTIKNIKIKANVIGKDKTGGLVGYNSSGGSIEKVTIESTVNGTGNVGGVMGYSYYRTTVSQIAAKIDVTSTSTSNENGVGGLIGLVENTYTNNVITIKESYTEGKVKGEYNVGGLIGYSARKGSSAGNITIENCFSMANVEGTTNVGGLIGYAIGNTLEIIECVDFLKGKIIPDLENVVLEIGNEIIKLAGKGEDDEKNKQKIVKAIQSGLAYDKFKEMVKIQGGNISYIENIEKFEKAKYEIEVKSTKEGIVQELNAEDIGRLACFLGAGRIKKEDKIDMAVGIKLNKKVGDNVEKNELLATIYANSKEKGEVARKKLNEIYLIL